ncbi:MAG: MFS transporter, partial [Crenarchaeota archaeon]|nr:MFS transporter [Thermoproteota archaeon]
MSFILRNIVLLYVTGFLMSIVFGFLTWYLPLIISERYGTSILGYVYFLINIFLAILSLTGGIIADSIGRRATLLLSALCLIFSTLLLFMIEQLPTAALASIILLMFSSSLRGPAALSLLTESIPQDRYSRFLSLASLFSTCGMTMGSILYSFLLTYIDVGTLYLTLVIISVLVLILCSFSVEINIKHERPVKIFNFSRTIFHVKSYVYMLISASLWALAISITEPYIAPVYKQVLELQVNIIGLIYAITFILRLAVTSLSGHIIEKLGPINAIVIDCVLSGSSLIIFTWLAKINIYAVSLLIVERALAIMSDIACYTLIAQIVPTDHRGSA